MKKTNINNNTIAILFTIAALVLFFACRARSQSIPTYISAIADNMITNGAVAIEGGKSLVKADTYQVGALYIYNITSNGSVGVIGGIDRLFTTGGTRMPSDTFTLAGGIQLSTKIAPLKFIGYTNLLVTTGVASLVGTPMSGQNGGNLMNLNRVFAYADLFTFHVNKQPVVLSVGPAFGNRTGAGSQYNGNWVNFIAGVHWGDFGQSMASADLEDQKIAETANAWQRL